MHADISRRSFLKKLAFVPAAVVAAPLIARVPAAPPLDLDVIFKKMDRLKRMRDESIIYPWIQTERRTRHTSDGYLAEMEKILWRSPS